MKILKIIRCRGRLAVCALLFITAPSWAATYYVDATLGDDTRDGLSEANAWKTVAKVNAATFMVPGDSVLFKCGETWREQLTVPSSGASGNPIVFGQYGSNCNGTNKPVLNAAEVVTGWSLHSGSIYKANVGSSVAQVFVDGQYISLAHYPNKGYLPQKPDSLYLTIAADSVQDTTGKCATKTGDVTFLTTGPDLVIPPGESIVGANVHVRTVMWRIEDRPVAVYDPTASRIEWQTPTEFGVCKNWGYYLDNKLWMLDEPGEWFYENGVLYVWLPDSTDPSAHRIEASRYLNGIYNYAKNNVIFRDFKIRYAGSYGVRINDAPDVELRNLDISDSGNKGIYVTGWGTIPDVERLIVDGCAVNNSVRDGIYVVSVENTQITNNQVSNTGVIGTPVNSFAAIRSDTNSAISSNNIINSGYIGIRFSYTSVVARNVIEDSCQVLDDCGAIYTWNKTTPSLTYSTQLLDNIVNGVLGNQDGTFSGTPLKYGFGIYLDEGTNGVEVGRNTVVDAQRGIFVNNAFANNVHDNIFYGNKDYQIYFNEYAPAPGAVVNNVTIGNTVFPFGSGTYAIFPFGASPSLVLNSQFDTINFSAFDRQLYSGLYSDIVVSESYKPGYSSGNNAVSKQYYDLAKWQQVKGQDINGRSFAPFGIAAYKSVQVVQSIAVPNGTFDSGISSWSGYPQTINWLSGCGLDGGCVNVTADTTQQNSANSAVFPLQEGKYYRLRFSAIALADNQTGRALVKIAATKTSVGLDAALIAGTERREYRFIFPATATLANAKIDLEVNAGNAIYFDNVRLEEITAEINDPNDDSRILINATDTEQVLPCPDADTNRCVEYIDLDGNPVIWGTDQVRLPSYSSKIVVWTNNPFRDGDRDGIADTNDACLGTAANASVNDEGCSAYQQIPVDLEVALSDTPDPALLGDTISYTVTVTNTGTSPASGVTVTGTLPSCDLGTIASNASASCTRTVTASTAGTLSHTMTANAAEYDPNPGNNTTTVNTTVNPSCKLASGYSLSGTVKTSGGTAIPGVTLTLAGPNSCGDRMQTDTRGKYKFLPLQGSYTVTPSKAGCSSFDPPSKTLAISKNKTQNFTGVCP